MEKLIKTSKFQGKNESVRRLIISALEVIEAFGIPIDESPRRAERMAMAFLACANVTELNHFSAVLLRTEDFSLKTREIIAFWNEHFEENVSRGSYDDIRRKDLKMMVMGGVISKSRPDSATNDSRRGYVIDSDHARCLSHYGTNQWQFELQKLMASRPTMREELLRKRQLKKVPVSIPGRGVVEFSPGEHNDLQKAIIEQFLPRYGFGAKLFYVGDTSHKYLHLDKEGLGSIGFFELAHDELPDVVAYSEEKNWLYLIEAVHSSGPISELRMIQLKRILSERTMADIVFVTAFLDRNKFRQYASEIAWELEVWIADAPDHMIHFNGDKFLGPYSDV